MSTTANKGFGLVIKTTQYTGNFEREMCAWLTGVIGECGVGEDMIDLLPGKPDFESNIMQVADEYDCHRPVSLHERNPNNLVIFFETRPTQEQIDFIKKHAPEYDNVRRTAGRMAKFYKNNKEVIEILGYELEQYTSTETREVI